MVQVAVNSAAQVFHDVSFAPDQAMQQFRHRLHPHYGFLLVLGTRWKLLYMLRLMLFLLAAGLVVAGPCPPVLISLPSLQHVDVMCSIPATAGASALQGPIQGNQSQRDLHGRRAVFNTLRPPKLALTVRMDSAAHTGCPSSVSQVRSLPPLLMAVGFPSTTVRSI
eukprot:TRINITY_DN71301_c0_g1_i1.p2 TRINITY_DN71301_c0_g1~~TRINITY_DN71301_c0_g1_i1.p2  ORF type:complete len:166 (-),score=22.76 TRINITY_DN71301_c0_g1_i1:57-554(-)